MNHINDTPEPQILAGEPAGTPVVHNKGFLSFHTGDLGGSSSMILGAKLRIRQATSGGNFNKNCLVDIKKGIFGTSPTLDGMSDFTDTTQTSLKAFAIYQANMPDSWFESNLSGAMAQRNVNLAMDGRTQFRIYFPIGYTQPRYEGWYSGNSTTYPPQLLFRHQ